MPVQQNMAFVGDSITRSVLQRSSREISVKADVDIDVDRVTLFWIKLQAQMMKSTC